MRQPGSTSRRLTGKEETHPGGEPVGFIIREWFIVAVDDL